MNDEREGGYINTYTGLRFYPLDPRPDDIRLEDIAQGLAHTCRYTGQCNFFYSVAQHSIHVSTELSRLGHGERVQLYGLLHDASEAYLSDIAGPVKEHLPAYKEMENRIQETVWEAFEIGEPSQGEWRAVKKADKRLLNYEAETLLSATWTQKPEDIDYELQDSIEPVRREFMDKAQQLSHELGAGIPQG